jgi:hypothetical protein
MIPVRWLIDPWRLETMAFVPIVHDLLDDVDWVSGVEMVSRAEWADEVLDEIALKGDLVSLAV